MRLGLGATAAVIDAPSSSDGSADTLRCAQYLVAGDRSRGVRLPRFGFLAGRNDRSGAAGHNGDVAFACVEGAVRSNGGDPSPRLSNAAWQAEPSEGPQT